MPLFRREYRLIFGQGGEVGSEVNDLQMTFDIVRTSDAEKNKCKIEVYNLAPTTRSLLETNKNDDTNNPVILLQTQYAESGSGVTSGNGFQTLFTGQVVNALTSKKNGDMITLIEAQDGYVPVRESLVGSDDAGRNFPPGTNRLTVLNALIGDMGIDAGEITDGGVLESSIFENGTTFEGTVKQSLDALLDPVNMDWSIQDGSMMVIRKDLASTEAVLLLSVDTGLIGSPQAKKARGNKTTDSENEPESGIKVMSLLAPTLTPNRHVRVISNEYPDGRTFKCTRVKHKGEFRGNNWITEAELADIGNIT